MAVITRLTRLLQADLHAVIDRLEAPDILLAQALREMEETIDADERALGAATEQQEQLRKRRAALEARLGAIAEELQVCLDAGEEGLARGLLRRRLETERLDGLLADREAELGARCERLTERLDARRRRFEALRTEAESLGRGEGAGWRAACEDAPSASSSIRDADVEVALVAEKRRRAR